MSRQQFEEKYLFKKPFAVPHKAGRFRRVVTWELLSEVLGNGHNDSWLPQRGRLPEDPELSKGVLTIEQAQKSFVAGRTVLLRHAERSSSKLEEIAGAFHQVFGRPIDIQVYCTPAGEEGFDWHYDSEDVFVIQSAGAKEFRLRENKLPREKLKIPCDFSSFPARASHQEMRCLLEPGDWLYIPAGCWHKARALRPSFHLSVGVSFLENAPAK